MSLVYNFAFAPPAAGATVTVTDDSGTEFATQALGTSVGSDGAVTLQVELDEGDYIGTVQGGFGMWSTRGTLDVPDSIASEATRGTLYLKASGTGLSLETATVALGDGAVLGFELDPDKQSSGDWWTQTESGFVLNEIADYRYGIAAKGTATYPEVPTLVYVDFYLEPDLAINLGMASDGTDNTPAFTPQLVTPLDFFCKEGQVTSALVGPHTMPITLAGLVCDNDGDQVAGATLDVEVRVSLTQVWSGERYTESDLT